MAKISATQSGATAVGQVGDAPEVIRLGSSRGGWFRRTGWRHLVGLLALAFSLFPILFIVSAALNPVGTLSSSNLIPTGASLQNFRDCLLYTSDAADE